MHGKLAFYLHSKIMPEITSVSTRLWLCQLAAEHGYMIFCCKRLASTTVSLMPSLPM